MTKKTTTKKATTKKTTVRKASTKKAPVRKAARTSAGAAQVKVAANTKRATTEAAKPKRLSGLDLAAKVVAESGEPINAKTIAERAIAAGWKTSGKTPHATFYAAIIREIAKKGKAARFVKTDRGLFAAGKGA